MSYICLRAGKEIVYAKNFVAAFDKSIDEVRTYKSSTSRNKNPASQKIISRHFNLLLAFPFSIGPPDSFKADRQQPGRQLHFGTGGSAKLAEDPRSARSGPE